MLLFSNAHQEVYKPVPRLVPKSQTYIVRNEGDRRMKKGMWLHIFF